MTLVTKELLQTASVNLRLDWSCQCGHTDYMAEESRDHQCAFRVRVDGLVRPGRLGDRRAEGPWAGRSPARSEPNSFYGPPPVTVFHWLAPGTHPSPYLAHTLTHQSRTELENALARSNNAIEQGHFLVFSPLPPSFHRGSAFHRKVIVPIFFSRVRNVGSTMHPVAIPFPPYSTFWTYTSSFCPTRSWSTETLILSQVP
jgi:hypothetical protein